MWLLFFFYFSVIYFPQNAFLLETAMKDSSLILLPHILIRKTKRIKNIHVEMRSDVNKCLDIVFTFKADLLLESICHLNNVAGTLK